MHDTDYKLLKEQFVSGTHGTSHAEVFMLAHCMPLLLCTGNAFRLGLGAALVPHRSIRHFTLELVTVLVPLVMLCMGALPLAPTFWILLALYAYTVLLPLFSVLLPHSATTWGHPAARQAQHAPQLTLQQVQGALNLGGPHKMYITVFRGGLMLYTCICILAVDFRAFPRRWAKAETYGSGLMDVGVGGIILASGLAAGSKAVARASAATGGLQVKGGAARSRGSGSGSGGSSRGDDPGSNAPDAKHGSNKSMAAVQGGGHRSSDTALSWQVLSTFLRRLAVGLRSALVCLVLGAGRLMSTKLLGYQEHLEEYGAHWNFFCTIAVVTLLAHLLPNPPPWLGLVVACAHQAVLSAGLGTWALSPQRGSDLLSLNKEGVVSCTGYWALYLVGAAMAGKLHQSCLEPLQQLRAAFNTSLAAGAGETLGEGGFMGRQEEGARQLPSCGVQRPELSGHLNPANVDPDDRHCMGRSSELEGTLQAPREDSCKKASAINTLHPAGYGQGDGAKQRLPLPPPTFPSVPGSALRPVLQWLLQWVALDLVLWVGLAVLERGVEVRSRRSCNAAYILWTAALSLSLLLPAAAAQVLWALQAPQQGGSGWPGLKQRLAGATAGHSAGGRARGQGIKHSSDEAGDVDKGQGQGQGQGQGLEDGSLLLRCQPWLPAAASRNMLAVFLAANLLTGAVNMSIDTLGASDWQGRGVVALYIAAVAALAAWLDVAGVRLPLR